MTVLDNRQFIGANASTVGALPAPFLEGNTAATVGRSRPAVQLRWQERQGWRPCVNLQMVDVPAPDSTVISQAVGNLNEMLATRRTGAGRNEGDRVHAGLPYLIGLAIRFQSAPRYFPLADGGLLARFDLNSGDSVQVEVDADDDVVVLIQDAEGLNSGYAEEMQSKLESIAARQSV